MKIWLDDVREPPDSSWTVVRNSRSFMTLVMMHWGEIDSISFDNDLGESVWEGRDCAELVMNLVIISDIKKVPSLYVHSANPVGTRSIEAIIEMVKIRGLRNDQV